MSESVLLQYTNSLITEEDVVKIVKAKLNSEDFKIVEYKFEPLEGAGMMGSHAMLNMRVRCPSQGAEEELSFFVKMAPHLEALAEEEKRFNAVQKEVNMYHLFRKMIAAGVSCIERVVPECYLIKDKVVVLENLKVKGYEVLPKQEDSVDRILGVLKSLAIFHASGVIFEHKSQQDILKSNGSDFENHFFDMGFETCINAIIQAFDLFRISVPSLETKIRNLYSTLLDQFRLSKNIRNLLCHGDPWQSNVLISRDNTCKFVDYQFPRYSAPTSELLMVIHLATTREFRKQHLTNAIETYYATFIDTLAQFGVDGAKLYPRDVFMESCKEYRNFAVLTAQYEFPFLLLESEDLQALLENNEDWTKASTISKGVAYDYARGNKAEYFARIRDGIADIQELLLEELDF